VTRRHFDPYEDLFDDPMEDEGDEFEGFHIVDSLDTRDEICYTEVVYCEFEFGDADGLCVRWRLGCRYQGCPIAIPND
jgi:hypothetical protein